MLIVGHISVDISFERYVMFFEENSRTGFYDQEMFEPLKRFCDKHNIEKADLNVLGLLCFSAVSLYLDKMGYAIVLHKNDSEKSESL